VKGDVMTNDLEGFRQWRDTVETRLATLETRVDDQEGLRAAMDEDMSSLKVEFRAQRKLLQSLHVTQQEHTGRFREMDEKLQAGFREVDEKMRTGFASVQAGVDAILDLLSGSGKQAGS
jgi:chromosome segregation ATPase